MTQSPAASAKKPTGATAVLVLGDGTVFWGRGIGAAGTNVGEVVFNTSITGYQEVLTDPSYAGQIITFTFPHIGNVGTNVDDLESTTPAARGCIIRDDITDPSNYRSTQHLNAWLKSNNIVGLAGLDTRRLTRLIRDKGAPNGVICHDPSGNFDIAALHEKAKAWPGLNGMDLAKDVTCRQTYTWTQTRWTKEHGHGDLEKDGSKADFHVVAVDYGAKRNILRCLADAGCKVTVVPATATSEDILRHKPDGVFLSNGPGDPAATGVYAVPVIRELIATGKPIFGICLGHQLLSLAFGAKTYKLPLGHRRRQPAGQRLGDRQGRDHLTESRFLRRPRDATQECHRDAQVAVRRHHRRHARHRQAGVLGAIPSRSLSGPRGQSLSLPPLHETDGGSEGPREG